MSTQVSWCDSATGNWLSRDPGGFEMGDANLYRAMGNALTDGVDPNGYDDITSVVVNKKPQYEAAEAEYKIKHKIRPIPILSAEALVDRIGRNRPFKWVSSAQGFFALPPDDPNVTHTMATDPVGDPVMAAGWGRIGNGNKIKIDNDSGHYQTPKNRLGIGKAEFELAGFGVEMVNDVGGKPKPK
jgi:hypothetical protein